MPDRDQMMDGLTSPYGEDMEQDYLPAMSYFSEGGEVDDDDEEGRPLAIPMRPVYRASGSPPRGEQAVRREDPLVSGSARMLRNITGEARSLQSVETPFLGSLGRGVQNVSQFVSAPFGYENPPARMLLELLGVPATGRAMEDVAQGLPLTRGRGQATQLRPDTAEALINVAPLAPVVAKTGAKLATKGARKALQELGPTAAGMAESLAARTGAAPMNIVPEGPAAVRPLTMTDRTEQGKLFAGRLDDFIASVRNPVTKGQLLGSLKGKFRDYEVSRAAQALQDLDDAAKITPAELASRIEGIATPNRYKTTFVDPKEAGLHNAYDNVYGKAGHPVGSINLSYVPTEEAISAEEVGNKVRAAISNLAGAPFEKIKDIREFVSSGLANQPEKQTAFLKGVDDLGAQLEQTRTKHGLFEEMQNLMYLRFPEQKGYYTLWQTKLKEIPTTVNRRENPELYDSLVKKATDEANMEVKLQALGRIQKEYGPILDSDLRSYLEALPQSAKAGGNELLTSRIDDLRKTLYTDLKTDTNAILADNVALLDDIRREADRFSTYKGSHTAVNPEKNAMGFSRFTEHTVNVPGMGKLDGIYVSELQSDMFRDIKKLGKLGGSKQSDLKEMQSLVQGMKTRFAPIEGKLDENYGGTDAFLYLISGIKDDPKTLSQVLQSPAIGLSPAKADQFATDFVKDSKRIKKLEERTGVLTNEPKGTYLIEEPIANIETQPQVVQQLLAKNAIAGAIQRGKSFVAFPGVESKQAKLYEKLPNNLRQVIKDLGEGFVTQPIIIKGKDGVERQHLAVIWDNNAAQRIMNQGVPFKKGGLVDKKAIEQKYAGGGIVKKAAQALTKMGAKESQVAGKELTTLQDTYTSLGDRINERVAKAQQQMDAMEFKYKPGQRVFTEDSAKKNKPPYTIKSKRLSGDMIVRDPKTLKAVRDPETGKAKRTPYEPGYLIREERGPDDWAEYVLPESAIKGSIDEFSKGGRVSKKLPGKRKYI